MNNNEVLAIREFRRFVNLYIYPETIFLINNKIKREFNCNQIFFDPLPQPTIKFDSNIIRYDNNLSLFTERLHTILKLIFKEYFSDPQIIKMIRNKIYTDITDPDLKQLLNMTLSEIQSCTPQYMGLLFNITILNADNIYVYL